MLHLMGILFPAIRGEVQFVITSCLLTFDQSRNQAFQSSSLALTFLKYANPTSTKESL